MLSFALLLLHSCSRREWGCVNRSLTDTCKINPSIPNTARAQRTERSLMGLAGELDLMDVKVAGASGGSQLSNDMGGVPGGPRRAKVWVVI